MGQGALVDVFLLRKEKESVRVEVLAEDLCEPRRNLRVFVTDQRNLGKLAGKLRESMKLLTVLFLGFS